MKHGACTRRSVFSRQHEPQRIVGDLLKAEISEKQARSIKYTIAKLPLAKDLNDFHFEGTPINDATIRARAVSATPTRSDGASATTKTRRSRGSLLDADQGSRSNAD
jgi:hypothetical protein